MADKTLTPEEVLKSFKTEFKNKIINDRIEKHVRGLNKNEFFHIWMKVDNSIFKDAVKHLTTIQKYPHFAVSSGYDLGKTIELVYHFSIFYGEGIKH